MRDTITSGETFLETVTSADHEAGAGWSARLVMVPRAGSAVITVNSTASGNSHLLQAAASVTADWAAGPYAWEIWALKAGEQYRLSGGAVVIQASLLGATGAMDTRTQAERDLEAITALLSGKASAGVQSYTINGRSLTSYPLPDLIRMRDSLRREVAAEQAAERLASGIGSRQRLVVRM